VLSLNGIALVAFNVPLFNSVKIGGEDVKEYKFIFTKQMINI